MTFFRHQQQRKIHKELTKRMKSHRIDQQFQVTRLRFQLDPNQQISQSFESSICHKTISNNKKEENNNQLDFYQTFRDEQQSVDYQKRKKHKITNSIQETQQTVFQSPTSSNLQNEYEAIHKILQDKLQNKYQSMKSNSLSNQKQKSYNVIIQQLTLYIDKFPQKYIIASGKFQAAKQSNEWYEQCIQSMKNLIQYVPKIHLIFKHIFQREYIVFTFLCQYYLPLKTISQLKFQTDQEGQLKQLLEFLLLKRQRIANKQIIDKWDIGITSTNKRIVWLPFQQNYSKQSIQNIYKQLFSNKCSFKMQLNSIFTFHQKRMKLGNRIIYLSSQKYQKYTIFNYSVNRKLVQIELRTQQKWNFTQSFKKQKGVVMISPQNYVKYFKLKNLHQFKTNPIKQYMMTKQFSRLDISPYLYSIHKDQELYCYFYVRNYKTLSEVFQQSEFSSKCIQIPSLFTSGEIQQNVLTRSRNQLFPKQNTLSKIRNDIREQLNSLHSKNIIHGDVSYGNIVYDLKNNKFILIDFEMSQALNENRGDKTYISRAFGTPKYMSKQMIQIYQQESTFINLYQNDYTCLENVMAQLQKKYFISKKRSQETKTSGE